MDRENLIRAVTEALERMDTRLLKVVYRFVLGLAK